MSSYKSGKPVFVISIIVVIAFILSPLVLVASYFILEGIDRTEVHKHVNIEYFEQLILRSEKIVAVYKDVEYVNPGNGFREYYSESHKTPVEQSVVQDIVEEESVHIYVCDGRYTCSATYSNAYQSFALSCGVASYEDYKWLEFYDGLASYGLKKETAHFPYNSAINFNNLVSYFVQ